MDDIPKIDPPAREALCQAALAHADPHISDKDRAATARFLASSAGHARELAERNFYRAAIGRHQMKKRKPRTPPKASCTVKTAMAIAERAIDGGIDSAIADVFAAIRGGTITVYPNGANGDPTPMTEAERIAINLISDVPGTATVCADSIEAYIASIAEPEMPTPEPEKQPREGKAQFDWEKFYIELTVQVHDKGLPAAQSDLIETMNGWCGDNWEKTPGETIVREKVEPIWDRLCLAEQR
jgi:hypothetical protein